jgi:organic radical activating enzyme
MLRDLLKRFSSPPAPLPAGIYATPLTGQEQGRLHLRIEPDGNGVLIVNAATILHLNQTACEFAYHLVRGSTVGDAGSEISRRYNISAAQARADYAAFVEQINTLRITPDLDPETVLNMTRISPRSQTLSAPLRVDCALTYRLPEGVSPAAAPTRRASRELATAEWRAVLEQAWKFGVPHVIFTGGEPTLRDDLVELIAYAESLGMVSGLLSDGLRFNQPGYLAQLLDSGLDHCLFLLNVDQDASWAALRRALAADIFVGVHLTLRPGTIMYDSLVEKLAGMGVRAISLTAADEQLKEVLADTAQQVNETGCALIWDIPVPYSAANPVSIEVAGEQPLANANRSWVYIEPDGDVLPTQGSQPLLGNVLRDSWADIWARAVERSQ